MAYARFFLETLASDTTSACTVWLTDAEAKHARASKRLSVKDRVILFDGRGHKAVGRIMLLTARGIQIAIDPVETCQRPTPTLTLAVALPKGPRQDTLIEKCTELGVAALWPLHTERSVSDASQHKRDKWQRKTIEAAKQSGQCWLPDIAAPRSLEEAIAEASGFDATWAAIPSSNEITSTPIMDRVAAVTGVQSILAFIGPEGGWTAEEVNLLLGSGIQPVSLGPNVLRIETASIAISAIVHAVAGR